MWKNRIRVEEISYALGSKIDVDSINLLVMSIVLQMLLVGPTEKRVNVGNLGRNMYAHGIDCGDLRETGEEVIQIKVYLDNILHRKYSADITVDFSQTGMVQVPLTLIS